MKAYFLSSSPTSPRDQQVINDYYACLIEKTDEELQDIVARERRCRGWVSRRALYLCALRQVCKERKLEFCWTDCDA